MSQDRSRNEDGAGGQKSVNKSINVESEIRAETAERSIATESGNG